MKGKQRRSKKSEQNDEIDDFVLKHMNGEKYVSIKIQNKEKIQRLWSGYGEIVRYNLKGQKEEQWQTFSVVVKNVRPPDVKNEGSLSHNRKVRSYQVETAFYAMYSSKLNGKTGVESVSHKGKHDEMTNGTGNSTVRNLISVGARIPNLLGNNSNKEFNLTQLLLEDLDGAGYPRRQGYGSNAYIEEEVKPMLQWLAQFHGSFLLKKKIEGQNNFPGLWEQGCYWHLDTRPDEFNSMRNGHVLKKAAKMLDRRLKHHSEFITLLHGDAKVCNFCFSDATFPFIDDENKQWNRYHVAAVDFQYCGGGIGLRDVAYLLQSCMDDGDLQNHEDEILNFYFKELLRAPNVSSNFSTSDKHNLEKEWRELWSTCFADFERFLVGWSYGHESYGFAKSMVKKALEQSFDVDSKP